MTMKKSLENIRVHFPQQIVQDYEKKSTVGSMRIRLDTR